MLTVGATSAGEGHGARGSELYPSPLVALDEGLRSQRWNRRGRDGDARRAEHQNGLAAQRPWLRKGSPRAASNMYMSTMWEMCIMVSFTPPLAVANRRSARKAMFTH